MKETLAEYLARGGAIVRCPPITGDAQNAMDRAVEKSKEERMGVIKRSPRNTPQIKRSRAG
jgi:hypothetical protein